MRQGLVSEEAVQHGVDQGAFLLVQAAQPATIQGLLQGGGQALVQPIGDQVAVRNLDVLLPERQIGQYGALSGRVLVRGLTRRWRRRATAHIVWQAWGCTMWPAPQLGR